MISRPQVVINHFVDSAEAKLHEAAAASTAALAEAERCADLEQSTSPEALIMSTMTEEGSKLRQERKTLVPWLVFVWETYRSVVELLRSSSRLEVVYHKVAHKAFDFCDKYKRKVRSSLRHVTCLLPSFRKHPHATTHNMLRHSHKNIRLPLASP